MAKKKAVASEAPAPAAPPQEKLIAVRAVEPFTDGNLGDAMRKYGYSVDWPRDEVRNLPRWLVERCIQSGLEWEPPE